MLAVLHSAVALAHLDTAPSEGAWMDIVSTIPAKAMTSDEAVVAPGATADLVLFPNARRASELFARPHHDRVVLRRGRPQFSSLPDFRDLDDLVAVQTTRTNLGHPDSVTRGAGGNNKQNAAPW